MLNNVEPLAQAWLDAKAAEVAARKTRIEIEQQIIEATGVKAEGSLTHEIGGYKVTVTGKLTRTIDSAEWGAMQGIWPLSVPCPVKTTYTPDIRNIRALMECDPEAWKFASKAFITKPAKTTINVKEI